MLYFLGEPAAREVIEEGRKVAPFCTQPLRGGLMRDCDEADALCNHLDDLVNKGQVRLIDI